MSLPGDARRRAVVVSAVVGLSLALAQPATGQRWQDVSMSRRLPDAEQLDVSIRYGLGRFDLRPTDDGSLYRMLLRYDEERFEPVAELERGRLTLGIDGHGRDVRVGNRPNRGRLSLELATQVEMDLSLELGAVEADVDLGGLRLTDLVVQTGAAEAGFDISRPNPVRMERARFEVGAADFRVAGLGNLNAESIDVSAGVGSIELDLGGTWRRDAEISIDMGLGGLELVIPRGLGVRLEKDSFLTVLDAQGLVKRGSAYYSVDWDDADRRVRIDIDAAFGSISVRWVG